MSLIILGIVSIVLVLLIVGTAIPATRPDAYTYPDLENPPRYVCTQATDLCLLMSVLIVVHSIIIY